MPFEPRCYNHDYGKAGALCIGVDVESRCREGSGVGGSMSLA